MACVWVCLKLAAAAFLLIAITLGYLTHEEGSPSLHQDIEIITNAKDVEEYLLPYRDLIGSDYPGYRGHIYRVLTYALHFLKAEGELVNDEVIRALSAALVFHDIGLWTASRLDYLDPSIDEALSKVNLSQEHMALVRDVILYHHKITPFTGSNEKVVNAARKADWIDATMGLIGKGMPAEHIQKVEKEIPNAGFHDTLKGFGGRLRGWNIPLMVVEMGSIFRW
jgi:hypothetical protein